MTLCLIGKYSYVSKRVSSIVILGRNTKFNTIFLVLNLAELYAAPSEKAISVVFIFAFAGPNPDISLTINPVSSGAYKLISSCLQIVYDLNGLYHILSIAPFIMKTDF